MSSNPDKTVIAIPENDVDQIIFTNTYKFTQADVMNGGLTVDLPEVFPDETLVTGIFSYDNGVTWIDCIPLYAAANINNSAYGSIFSYANTAGAPYRNKIEFQYTQKQLVNGGNPYTLTLKIAVSLNPKTTQFDTSISKFTGLNAYSSNNQYLKIAAKGFWVVPTNTASNTLTIAHNLGYVPFVEVFWNDSTTISKWINITSAFGGGNYIRAYADTNNLYLNFGSTSGFFTANEIYYKIYSKG